MPSPPSPSKTEKKIRTEQRLEIELVYSSLLSIRNLLVGKYGTYRKIIPDIRRDMLSKSYDIGYNCLCLAGQVLSFPKANCNKFDQN